MRAPGMAEAMEILTAREASMSGGMTVNEYINVVRGTVPDVDPIILASAQASLAHALLAIASEATGQKPRELLGTIGLELSQA